MKWPWSRADAKSPYLSSSDRLGDVIAAIQAMGTYKFYKLSFELWAYRIGSGEKDARHWERLFKEHPEFFRIGTDGGTASLIIRRQHPKLTNVDTGTAISIDEYQCLDHKRKKRISRAALSPNEIATLINTAIQIHARALERERDARWWLPIFTAGAGFVGAILGALLR